MTTRARQLQAAMNELRRGQPSAARRLIAPLLADNPGDVECLYWDAEARAHIGDQQGARRQLEAATALRPDLPVLFMALARVCAVLGDWDAAMVASSACLEREPDNALAHFLRGEAWRQRGDASSALRAYRAALSAEPRLVEAHNNSAALLAQTGAIDEAVAHYKAALSLQPDFVHVWMNLADVLTIAGRIREAIEAYRSALAIAPGLATGHNDLALALLRVGELDAAEQHARKAVDLDPGRAIAHANLGAILKDQGYVADAVAACQESIARDEFCWLGWSNLLSISCYVDGEKASETRARALGAYASAVTRSVGPVARPAPRHRPGAKVRIGYVSADFRDHAVYYFLAPILEAHDRERFELFCYDCSTVRDAANQRLRATRTQWRDSAALADQELADLVRADGIDILVDLMGHTADNRLNVFARRPAPIQVNWLGWPGSTGLAQIDFRLVDAHIAAGLDDERNGAEQLIALPDTWLCYRADPRAPDIAKRTASSDSIMTFGSFNAVQKQSPRTLDTWSRLLLAAPRSRLIVAGIAAGRARHRLEQHFAAVGLLDRVEMLAPCGIEDFFALHARVDVALDPFPFNGSTTTLHSLWMGVPVVTLAGRTHAGRMGVSIMKNLDLDRLIAVTESDYVDAAIEAARDREWRADFRAGIRTRMQHSPLMQASRFTHALEGIYEAMLQQQNQPAALG